MSGAKARLAAAQLIMTVLEEHRTLDEALAQTETFDDLNGSDRGFARAMAAMNVYVTWTAPAAHSSTVCASGDIALCTPLPKPMISGGALDPASVTEMWRVVSGIVSRSMPLGTVADRSTFREYELRIQLSDALINRYWNAYGWSQPRSMY